MDVLRVTYRAQGGEINVIDPALRHEGQADLGVNEGVMYLIIMTLSQICSFKFEVEFESCSSSSRACGSAR